MATPNTPAGIKKRQPGETWQAYLAKLDFLATCLKIDIEVRNRQLQKALRAGDRMGLQKALASREPVDWSDPEAIEVLKVHAPAILWALANLQTKEPRLNAAAAKARAALGAFEEAMDKAGGQDLIKELLGGEGHPV